VNHSKIYYSIIDKRKTIVIDDNQYYERHHILPKSLGGLDESNNIVKLSAREHFICHLLLTKMYKFGTCEWYKMNAAFRMMLTTSENQSRHMPSKKYEFYRQEHAKWMKFCQSGDKNSQYGSKIIYNIESGDRNRLQLGDKIPIGWCDSFDWKKIKRKKLSDIKKEKIKKSVIELHKIYKNSGCNSIREFCKSKFYDKSHVNLTNQFKKYIPELYNSSQGKSYK
jgi:hypothetical protein